MSPFTNIFNDFCMLRHSTCEDSGSVGIVQFIIQEPVATSNTGQN